MVEEVGEEGECKKLEEYGVDDVDSIVVADDDDEETVVKDDNDSGVEDEVSELVELVVERSVDVVGDVDRVTDDDNDDITNTVELEVSIGTGVRGRLAMGGIAVVVDVDCC